MTRWVKRYIQTRKIPGTVKPCYDDHNLCDVVEVEGKFEKTRGAKAETVTVFSFKDILKFRVKTGKFSETVYYKQGGAWKPDRLIHVHGLIGGAKRRRK